MEQLVGFQLDAFHKISDTINVFSYIDATSKLSRKIEYTITPTPIITKSVKRVYIAKSANSQYLTICELMVFGGEIYSVLFMNAVMLNNYYFFSFLPGVLSQIANQQTNKNKLKKQNKQERSKKSCDTLIFLCSKFELCPSKFLKVSKREKKYKLPLQHFKNNSAVIYICL